MGFNFGAFLGGAASQITKDIDEEQDRVKLRMDKILDKQQDLTIQNQKEYKAKKEKVTNQLNALVPLFGDDPQALAKARSIVAGGDSHYTFMYNKLQEASGAGQNVNEIYGLIPNKDAVGFESVEDATDSLVKIAELPEIKISESSGMAKLFGIDQKAYYNKERKVLEEVGQIQSATAGVPEKGVFAQGKLDLSKMKKVFKSADEFEANLLSDVNKFEVGTKEYNEASKKYEDFRVKKAKTSAGYITEELRQKNEKNKNAITYGYVQKGWLEGKEGITDKYGDRIEVGTKILLKGSEEYNQHVNKEVNEYNKEFVKGILDDIEGGNLSTNGLKLIQSTPELKKIANQIQKDKLKGGDDKETKDNIKLKPGQRIGKFLEKESSKNLSLDVISQIKNIKPDITDSKMFDILEEKYPKKDSETQDEYDQRLKRLIDLAFKGFKEGENVKKKRIEQKKKLFEKKPSNLAPKVSPRGNIFSPLSGPEWDKKYGKFYNIDGKLKNEFK